MLPLETLGAFFVTAIVMGLAPGPDNIFVLTQSALYGFRAGIVTTLGLMTGLFGHTAAVALGVAALFQTSEMAFMVLKCAGAAYLLYLAWLSFRSGASRAWLEQSTFPGYWALYRRGVIMNITNPKVTLFFPPTVCQAGTRECPASDRHPWPPLPARYAGRLRRRFIPWRQACRMVQRFHPRSDHPQPDHRLHLHRIGAPAYLLFPMRKSPVMRGFSSL